MADRHPNNPYGKVFGRRIAHPLSAAQQQRLDEQLPKVEIDLTGSGLIDPGTLFKTSPETVCLEIGFGGGEHLIDLATANPQTGFLGCEPFVNGVVKLLGAMAKTQCANIRIHHGDARLVLDRLQPGSIARIYLLYPDPWPKKRHHKRRFISPDNLARLHRILCPGGELFIASDISSYVRWALQHIIAHGGFVWTAATADDWRQPFPGWRSTRYEQKALKAGRVPTYLHFTRH